MRHPYLCVCLTFALSVTAYHSGVRLNAAELWNSTGVGASSSSSYYVDKKSSKKGNIGSYYNVPGNSSSINRATLYNVKDATKLNSLGGGLETVVQAYNNVKMGRQKKSRQFSTMSADAVSNRQADIDHALQIEYSTRKSTAMYMIEVYKKDEAARVQGLRDHQDHLAAMRAEKETKALERQRKKDRALGRASGRRISSARGGKRVVNSSSSRSSTGLKKPARLFNDPNR